MKSTIPAPKSMEKIVMNFWSVKTCEATQIQRSMPEKYGEGGDAVGPADRRHGSWLGHTLGYPLQGRGYGRKMHPTL